MVLVNSAGSVESTVKLFKLRTSNFEVQNTIDGRVIELTLEVTKKVDHGYCSWAELLIVPSRTLKEFVEKC